MGRRKMFFASKEEFAPCGVYTAEHIIAALICFLIVAITVFSARRARLDRIYLATRILAPVLTLLEMIKIGHNFYWGYTNIDSWVPLSFCSLFIYASYLSGYGKGELREYGNSYMVIGGIVAGAVFVFMPTTSLTMYPLFHFQSLYSLLFHSLMMIFGILLFMRGVRPTKSRLRYYSVYFVSFAAVSLTINTIAASNLMLLREPYKIPIELVHLLYQRMPFLYTLLGILVHLTLPPIVMRIADGIYFGKKFEYKRTAE